MDYYTYISKQADPFDPRDIKRSEIRVILQDASQRCNVSFQEEWIRGLMCIFNSKQEIAAFCNLFQSICDSNYQNLYADFEEQDLGISNQKVQEIDNIEFDSLDFSIESEKIERCFPQQVEMKVETYSSHYQWLQTIQSIIQQNPYLSAQQISDRLKLINAEEGLSPQSVQSKLMMIGYSQKKLTKVSTDRNSLQNLENRYQYCLEYYRLSKSDTKLFFIDCCKFDLNLAPQTIWVKQNSPIIQSINDSYLDLFMSISQDEQYFWQIHQKCKGSSDDFLSIQKILQQIDENNKETRIAIITENIPVTKQLKRFLLRSNWKLFLLPSMSPQLNPINSFFQEVKAKLRGNSFQISTINQLENFLHQACMELSLIHKFFDSLNSYILKGLTKSYF